MDTSKLTIEEKTNIAKFNISNDERYQLEKVRVVKVLV